MVRVFAFLALFVPLASLSAGDFADISYEDLVTAIEKGEVTVIDNNGTALYEKAHITGAIDFQSAKKLGSFESQLPENKDALRKCGLCEKEKQNYIFFICFSWDQTTYRVTQAGWESVGFGLFKGCLDNKK